MVQETKVNKDLIDSYVGFDPLTTRIRKEDKLTLLSSAYESKVPEMVFNFIVSTYKNQSTRLNMIETYSKDIKEYWKREKRKAS